MTDVTRYDVGLNYDDHCDCGACYSVSNRTCVDGEYVKYSDYDALRAINAELLEALENASELIEHGKFAEGHCMCGSPVDRHGIGDGHSPVDAGEYYAGQVLESTRAVIAKARSAK